MFDLMGAIRKKQTRPPADSADSAESPQPRGLQPADELRKAADFSANNEKSANVRKNPQTGKTCEAATGEGYSGLSANPQNPQPPVVRIAHNPDALLAEVAVMLQAGPGQLRDLLSADDLDDIAQGCNSRTDMLDYFRLMRADGKLPVCTEPPAKASNPPPSHMESAKAWKPAHEAMINHAMACTACRAPQGRYCDAGAELRRFYWYAQQSAASRLELEKT
jgi:hypothetical protein